MATDYDAPRQKETDDVVDESLEALAGRRNDAATAVLDVDDGEELEDFELPGADLSGEEFTVRVVPKQPTSSPARAASWCNTATALPGRWATGWSAPIARDAVLLHPAFDG